MVIIPEAVGANNIFSLDDGAFVFELRDWLKDEYGTMSDEAPGLIKIANKDKKVIKTRSGWFLGGKSLDKIAVLEEHSQEYSYQITVLRPNLPEKNIKIEQADGGFWTVYGITRNDKSPYVIIVLHRPFRNPFYTKKKKKRHCLLLTILKVKVSLQLLKKRLH